MTRAIVRAAKPSDGLNTTGEPACPIIRVPERRLCTSPIAGCGSRRRAGRAGSDRREPDLLAALKGRDVIGCRVS